MPAQTSLSAPADGPTRATRALAVALLAALIALCLGWELWWAPTGRGTLAIKVLPLLPTLPGLLRLRMYTYRWLSLLVWLYAAEGLVRIGSETGLGARLAGAEVLLAVGLFAACVAHVRWRLKHATPAPAST
ncbi:DUF2069 domain-containing protein [Ideonella sp.]|uniref:DUF2069 domain-containing protein n=1 Tax=Ideonella sp. TaxID=1929293 RepID=UPI002B49E029|nr:DUF2069 domain-containing protein [Ideonella sp.]HJV71602.1 DUF2069 domain-containing protein [Ideonella sp.]